MEDNEKKIFDVLKDIALEDNIVSLDETMIISHAMSKATSYEESLIRAKADGIITEEEKIELAELRQKVVTAAFEIAAKDRKISSDEAKLIKKLMEIVNNWKELEN